MSSSSGYDSSLNSLPSSLNSNLSSSGTDDDSQSTIIQQRPRSLPISIQQSKSIVATNNETNNDSSFSYCTNNSFQNLEHFIMSPTDQIKIQMKYQENDAKNLHLQSPQPEFIDFKRSKLKAIRVLYQNRLQFPVEHQVEIFILSSTCLLISLFRIQLYFLHHE